MGRKRLSIRALLVMASAIAIVGVALSMSGVLRPVIDPAVAAVLNAGAALHGAGRSADKAVAGDGRKNADPLAATVDALRLENAKLRTAAEENEELKAALKFSERKTDHTVMARVVSGSSDPSFDGIVIDRGSEDGIKEGQPVLTTDGVIIGKIHAVRAKAASVRLLADSGSRLAVAIRDSNDTLGVLEGERGLGMKVTLIPQNDDVNPGDVIVTSGSEPGIRRGYPVGTVEEVGSNTQDPFQTASVAAFRSADRPIFVQVVIPQAGL